HRLEPVRFLKPFGRERMAMRNGDELPFWKRRLRLGRTHVGPENAPALDERVRPQLDALGESRRLGLRRHVDALSGDVVLPPVVGAAEAALLVPAEPERYAAVRAELIDEPQASFSIAERQEPFGQQLHADWRAVVFGQLVGQEGR